MAAATGITVPASNGRIEVKDPNGREYLRAQFEQRSAADHAFTNGLAAYEQGEDLRRFAKAAIAQRRGQGKFRDSLVDAYDSRCAVTGSSVLAVLEAAHIDRYFGDHSNHVTNGLLLRADIHTLFDLQRITVDENLKIRVTPSLLNTEYGIYEGATLRVPDNTAYHPDRDALQRHRDSCDWLEKAISPIADR
jgi:predicted restriction endonuclease